MCKISVNIDEIALRDMCPELNTTAAISRWAQELIDSRIIQMEYEDSATMSIEEARAMAHTAIQEEYAQP